MEDHSHPVVPHRLPLSIRDALRPALGGALDLLEGGNVIMGNGRMIRVREPLGRPVVAPDEGVIVEGIQRRALLDQGPVLFHVGRRDPGLHRQLQGLGVGVRIVVEANPHGLLEPHGLGVHLGGLVEDPIQWIIRRHLCLDDGVVIGISHGSAHLSEALAPVRPNPVGVNRTAQ